MPENLLSAPERTFLLGLQRQALHYFIENQTPSGLILDRQANHRSLRTAGWCSTAATGMGLVALALATAEPYRLLTSAEAVGRVRAALKTALEGLLQDHGMLPHFLDSATLTPQGVDAISTIDSSWLLVGALWSAAFLGDACLKDLANQLYDRVDFLYWTAPLERTDGLVRHGKGSNGQFLTGSWDRLNGETVFMYVLGAGAEPRRSLPPECWTALRPFYGTVAGLRFNNADLGLFAFQYGLDLLDLTNWLPPGGIDLAQEPVPNLAYEARIATRANFLVCREAATKFATYRRFWGLSDGDGPCDLPGTDAYRTYGPGILIDGTANLNATLAAVANAPDQVLDALTEADRDVNLGARGRYGFSNVNLDRNWVGGDMVGIDAGAAVLALDNYLMADRVRRVFHTLACVARGLQRLRFTHLARVTPAMDESTS
jgi:hypothetical protein